MKKLALSKYAAAAKVAAKKARMAYLKMPGFKIKGREAAFLLGVYRMEMKALAVA